MTAKMLPVLFFGIVCLVDGQPGFKRVAAHNSDQPKLGLARAVVEAIRRDHRGGSLIYRGKCLSGSQINDDYILEPSRTTASLEQTLNNIARNYPTLQWIDFGREAVRVFDRSSKADVLNLRVKEFRLQDVANPDLAISAIWNIPEVKAFATAHHITFVGLSLGPVPPEGTYTRISVDIRDGSVAEIMDAIVHSYRRSDDPEWRGVWVYRECEAAGQRLVEFQVL